MTAVERAAPTSIGRNLLWKLAGTAGEKAIRLGFVVLATRALGDVSWGQVSYAIATTALFAQIADLGTSLFVARETAARGGGVDPALVGGVGQIRLRLGGAYAGVVGVLCLLHADEPAMAAALAIAGAGWWVQASLEYVWHVFRGLETLRVEARLQLIQATLQTLVGGGVVVALLMGWWDRGWPANYAYMGTILLANAWTAALALRLLRREVRPERGLTPALWGRFRGEVLPLGVAIVASLVYYKIDVPMLRHYAGDAVTGHYAAAYRLLEMVTVAPSIAMAATFPALSRTLTTDRDAARRLHRRARAMLLALGLVVGGVFVVAAEPLVALLYGAEFEASVPVLRALGAAVALTFVNYVETHMLVALGLVRWQMSVALALCGLNVGLNAWVIPTYGAAGAAWTTAATEAALFLAVWPAVRRAMAVR
ncbi:MAG: hypothetical protein RIT45_1359 [Pseudomonadota bacterium]